MLASAVGRHGTVADMCDVYVDGPMCPCFVEDASSKSSSSTLLRGLIHTQTMHHRITIKNVTFWDYTAQGW